MTREPAPRPTADLGGGLNPSLVEGRLAGWIEKRHLVMARLAAEIADARGERFLDFGTDRYYPYFDIFPPTWRAIEALAQNLESSRRYPSSYGTAECRAAIADFMRLQFGVQLSSEDNVLVTMGASQAFDALTRTYRGQNVLVPDMALSTVTSIAVGNGGRVLRIPLTSVFELDLVALDETVRRAGANNIRFLYINSPMNPTGALMSRRHLEELVALAHRHRILLVHDHDSWYTTHCGERSTNILEVQGASDVAVSILSVSKELGLPGLRVGAVVGNKNVVNDLRIHNSEFCVMIPQFTQAAMAAALRCWTENPVRQDVQNQIHDSLNAAVEGWRRLGWPAGSIMVPPAGYKFLVRPPRAFENRWFGNAGEAGVSGVELFDFLVARDVSAKLSTSRSFNPLNAEWLRMIIMQPAETVRLFFDRLEAASVRYDMDLPQDLFASYQKFFDGADFWNL